jgi:alcohol dehydrogenase (cytochrome c)
MATLDAHVIALDTKTGNLLWDVVAADYHQAYTFTVAPLALKNEIIVGVSGGDYGVRGFIEAYDADTGRRRWRFNTVPGPGESGHETWSGDTWKTGGAPAWITGSYDPQLNLLYWSTGNPAPSNYGGDRVGDNLYSNSILALDPDTGKLKWYFQFTPHDLYDYDATQIPVLLDAIGAASPANFSFLPTAMAFSMFSIGPTANSFEPSRLEKLLGLRESPPMASRSSILRSNPRPKARAFVPALRA